MSRHPPPGGGSGGDPYPATGPFTPPDASDFPDALIVNPAPPSGDLDVGALQGSGGVSGGQASYSIPIVIPPGRKGMQPSVSLNYSSSSGNGLVGVGWGLSAGSAITRCAATADPDGFTAAVQYDASRDRLCLDGMRLVVATGTYGQSGSTYRTELDSFTRITLYNGDINGSTSFFYVEHKDGRIRRYGLTGHSRQKALGRSEVLTWAIYDEWDRASNFITYDYTNEGDGEYLLEAIHYTGRSGVQGTRHVRFNYEPRTNPRSFYLAGGKSRMSKRLKEIKTEYQSTLVRRYSLTYKTSDYSDRDLLTNVQECAYENGVTAHCLPTTDFEWQESGQQFEAESRLYFWQGSSKLYVHGDKEELHLLLPRGDIDGDGVKDWDDHQVNAEGQITGSHTVSYANCFKPANSLRLTCLDADLNADGITDGLRRNGSVLEISLNTNAQGGPTWTSTGITWANHPYSAALSDSPLGFADFNGDGWVDLAMKTGGHLWVYFHTKNLTAPYSAYFKQWIHTYGTQGYFHTTDVQIYGDMDGNGTPDFVVSNIQAANDTPGLPTPSHIILTTSNAGGTLTTSTRNVPSYVSLQSAAIATNANFFHDINGDGLQDLVSVKENTVQLQYKENTGTAFGSTWKNLGFSIPYREVQFELTSGEPAVAAYPIMSKLLVMDYDGNGKDDMLVASNTVYASSCTKIAQSQGPSAWKCDDELYETYQAAPYAAVEAPINGSSLDNSVRPYNGYKFEEDALGNITSVPFSTSIVASASQTAVVDVTGDGLPDVVTAFGCRNDPACQFNGSTYQTGEPWQGQYTNSTYSATGAWINRNRGTSGQAVTGEFDYAGYDLLSAAEDGLGNRSEWTYKPLSSDAYDTTASNYYDVTHADEATNSDYFHFASSMNVVAEHKASNGIGGLNSTLYRYRGAIYNNKGRGFQGFQTIIVEEDVYDSTHPLANTDKISRTDFHQYWPVSSFIDQSCTWLVTDNATNDNPTCSGVISKTVVDDIHDVATVGGARFVAVKEQTDTSYDLAYPARTLLTTKNVVRSFDAYGNVTSESHSHVDDWTSNLTTSTAVYTATEATWWLNKLESQTVTTNPVSARHTSSPTVDPAQDGLKWVKTTYAVYDTTKRIPTEVTVTANDTAQTSTITTTLSSVGLPLTITTTGTDLTGPRTVTTTYSEDGTTQSAWGYFPLTVTNALGHVATVHTSPIHGQPTSHWDVNGLLTTTVYDAFGRVSDVTPPGTPTAFQRYEWCDGAVWCITGATYRVQSIAAGSPRTYAYFDSFGREIYAISRNFADTNYVRVRTTYDARGNQTFISVPHDPAAGESSSKGTRYLAYDALGRLTSKEVDQTDGQILLTNYTHSNFTTNINAGGILMHRIYNGLGQLVETKDGEGGFTKYAYDGAGNPVIIQDPLMVGTSTGIKAAFDALGQKKWVYDPDWVGQKTFTYNALGEVLSETDPNGNLIEMTYDALGRLIDRHVNSALNGKWHYDNTDTYKGLGLLDFEDSQFRADGSRHQKFYYYSDATTGRKDLLQVKHRFYENGDQYDYEEYDVAHFTDGYYARPKGLQYPGGAKVAFEFNGNGHLIEENDPESAVIYRQITGKNSRGQTTTANIGKHLGSFKYTQTNTFHQQTGQADTIQVSNASATLQDLSYGYDVFGNLYTRSNGTTTETLYYDDVQRLVSATRSPGSAPDKDAVSYSYDGSGNFLTKSDYRSVGTDVGATYFYETGRPHVLDYLTLDNASTVQIDHDANGNMTLRGSEIIAYNAFNKPLSITGGGISATFTYGANLMRYRQETPSGATIYYVDKLMEIESFGTSVDYRHYLGDIAILTKTGDLNDPNPGIRYLFKDRLGSTATIGDTTGLDVESRAFDAFGKPRNGDWTDKTPPRIGSSITDRGFTDHEHLDDWQLIHMNGRGYDYNLGRFLSVDPIIQSPGNSQSINGFSYIGNNPLSGTDPTGYTSEEEPDGATGGGRTVVVKSQTKEKVATIGSRIRRHEKTTTNGTIIEEDGTTRDFKAEHIENGHSQVAMGSASSPDEIANQESTTASSNASDGSQSSSPETSQSEAYDPDKHGKTPEGYRPPQNPYASIICDSGCSVTTASEGVGALLAGEVGVMLVVDRETGLVHVFSYVGGGGSLGAQAFVAYEGGLVSMTTVRDLSGLGYSANYIAAWNVGTTGQVFGGADLDNLGVGNGTIGATAGGVVGWGGGLTGLVTWTTYRGSYTANDAPQNVTDILRRVDK